MVLSKTRITKALIRLRERTGWSAPVLFINPKRLVYRVEAHIINNDYEYLELFAAWVIFHPFLSSADFFKINFFEKFFQKYH